MEQVVNICKYSLQIQMFASAINRTMNKQILRFYFLILGIKKRNGVIINIAILYTKVCRIPCNDIGPGCTATRVKCNSINRHNHSRITANAAITIIEVFTRVRTNQITSLTNTVFPNMFTAVTANTANTVYHIMRALQPANITRSITIFMIRTNLSAIFAYCIFIIVLY